MLLVARRWKLPCCLAYAGATTIALGASLPFVFIYRLCTTAKAMAAAVAAQIAFTFCLASALLLHRMTRDPERVSPKEKGIVVSAADGMVIYIKPVAGDTTPLVTKHGKAYRLDELMGTGLMTNGAHIIGVEMNLLNVHTNRCPIAGRVQLIHHVGGKFISLREEEAPFVNERCTTVIQNDSIAVGVVQVASRLVRRIDNILETGHSVGIGQRLGVIRLGSLVALVIPKREDVSIVVHVGDHVAAGLSILARYTEA